MAFLDLFRRVENVFSIAITTWYTEYYSDRHRKMAVLGKYRAQNSQIGIFDKKRGTRRNATYTLGQGGEGVSKDGRRVVRYSLHQVVDHCIDSKAGDRFDARLVGDVLAVGVDGVDRDA